MKNLTKSQKTVLFHIMNGKNIFIQGVAGTGKTWLLKNLENLTKKEVRLFATSGLASVNLGGHTVSSNYGLKLGLYDKEKDMIQTLNSSKWDLETIIVIDEVALLSEEQFHQIDYALRCRGLRNHLFGGFQLIMAGDFKQMPHIGWGTSLENSIILTNFKTIELIENVRQANDVPFFNILKNVRENGFDNETITFITQNHKPKAENSIQIVATRQLMDELNNALKPPTGVKVEKYSCDLNDDDRAYDSIRLWEGMPIIITRNDNRKGYYNGDTGIVVEFDENDDEVKVRLDRTSEDVWVSFVNQDYLIKTKEVNIFEINDFEDKSCGWFRYRNRRGTSYNCRINEYEDFENKLGFQKITRKDFETEFYSYMPILPASYLSIRRCQGLTLTNGVLHESILNAYIFNQKDRVNIQYVALSRFEKINQVHVKGLDSKQTKEKLKEKITLKIA